MKQLKDLKLNDTVLTEAEVDQKIADALTGSSSDDISVTKITASSICGGNICATNVSTTGVMSVGCFGSGPNSGSGRLDLSNTGINSVGTGGRGLFSFNSLSASKFQVVRQTELQCAICCAVEELEAKIPSGSGVSVDEINGLKSQLTQKADKSHTHAMSDVSGLSTALGEKAAAVHSHKLTDVSDLCETLDSKADQSAVAELADRVDTISDGVVHTTGEETIGGAKTFTSSINIAGKTLIETNVGAGVLKFTGVGTNGAQVALKREGVNVVVQTQNNGVVATTWTLPGGDTGTVATREYVSENTYSKDQVDEKLCGVTVDLSGYYTKDEIDDKLVDGLIKHTHCQSEIDWSNDANNIDICGSFTSGASSCGSVLIKGTVYSSGVTGAVAIGADSDVAYECYNNCQYLFACGFWETYCLVANTSPICPHPEGNVSVGAGAFSFAGGVATGLCSGSCMYGTAVGAYAIAGAGGVAIGADAHAGNQRIVIGCSPALLGCTSGARLSDVANIVLSTGGNCGSGAGYPFTVAFSESSGMMIHYMCSGSVKCIVVPWEKFATLAQ